MLGLVIRSDMRWCDNTNYICQKGYKRLWILRRLRGLGASSNEMLDVYFKQVRSVLELAVPVWQPALTIHEVNQIERLQKCALAIILGDQYNNYDQAREQMGIDRLSDRRKNLCENFVKKAAKSEKFQNWFNQTENVETNCSMTTRRNKNKTVPLFREIPTRTSRYKKSPLPYLTEMLNEMNTMLN